METPRPGDLGPIIGLTFAEASVLSELARGLSAFDTPDNKFWTERTKDEWR